MIDIVVTADNSGSMEDYIQLYRQALLGLIKTQMNFMEDARLTILNFQSNTFATRVWRIPLRAITLQDIEEVWRATGGTNVVQGYGDALKIINFLANPPLFNDFMTDAGPLHTKDLLSVSSRTGPEGSRTSNYWNRVWFLIHTIDEHSKLPLNCFPNDRREAVEAERSLLNEMLGSCNLSVNSPDPDKVRALRAREMVKKISFSDHPLNPLRVPSNVIHVFMTDGECGSMYDQNEVTRAKNIVKRLEENLSHRNISFSQIFICPSDFSVTLGGDQPVKYLKFDESKNGTAKLFKAIDETITQCRSI